MKARVKVLQLFIVCIAPLCLSGAAIENSTRNRMSS